VNQPTAPCPKPPHAHAPPNAPTCLAADYHPSSFGEIGAAEFLLDSAATAHIAHNRSLFENYTPCTDNSVVITGAGSLPVAGYGTVLVTDPDKNATFALHGVMHVPDCPVNIFSTTELNLEGGTFATTRSTATIRASSGNTLTTTQNYKGIFILPALLPSSVCYIHLTNDSLETWHRRFGHVGYDTLKRIVTLKCVDGMIVEGDAHPPECIACVTGKFRRSPFPTDTKTYAPLEMLHSDISGDYPTALNGHRYFTTVRDKATGYTVVHSHSHKHEAATFVKNTINSLERETGRRVRYLRTDRGGEYMSHDMQQWLQSKTITHQPTTVESSASNGVAERVNLTLMNRVRATLVHSNQPRLLWPWALQHVAHALNYIPSASNTKTPHELMFNTRPDVSHLHVFGAAVASWVPTQDRPDKLVPRAHQARFVGYTPSDKIFKVGAAGGREIGLNEV